MSASSLVDRFMRLYPELRERLKRRLGSLDLADEALGEAYLKVGNIGNAEAIQNPRAYLFRLAMNAAVDQRRSGARLASAAQIDAALELPDTAPDAFQVADARRDLAILEEAVAALPERRRMILKAARLEERSCQDISEELGVSKRTVEMELRKAIDHCADWLARARGGDFAVAPDQTSYH